MSLSMNRELNGLEAIIEGVSREKNLERSVVIQVIEQAVLQAARHGLQTEADLEAAYNPELKEIELFQFRKVISDTEASDEASQIHLSKAKVLDPEAELGDSLGVKIDTAEFGRIAIQSAKHVLMQKVKEAERKQVYEEFKGRTGEIMSGYVHRLDRRGQDVIVNLGKIEGILPFHEQIRGEKFRVKDKIQAYVLEVREITKGQQVVLSRAHPGFLIKLFEQNVTEIADGVVSIASAARDPGLRAKISVYSKDANVDPVGACVGIKGVRVQSIMQELHGEKIDIIPWDKDHAKMVCHALAPALVNKVVIDDERHTMEVVVSEDQLSLAIGRHGQNVKLAAQLTGWRLEIKSEAKLEEQLAGMKAVLATIEGLGDMHAGILVHEGIRSPEELAQMPPRVLARLLNLEIPEAEKMLQAAAQKAAEFGQREIADSEEYASGDADAIPQISDVQGEQENRREKINIFLKLRGIGEATAYALAEGGYATIGDIIADSPEELVLKTGITLGIAKTVQKAADAYLQEYSENNG